MTIEEHRHQVSRLANISSRLDDYRFYLALALTAGWVALVSGDSRFTNLSFCIPILSIFSTLLLGVQVWMVRKSLESNIHNKGLTRWINLKVYNWLEIVSILLLLVSIVSLFVGIAGGIGTSGRWDFSK
ncbi:hypothetical protein KJ836_03560 [Patescibacteria group bacterium]|nr:hypothetical protein [Patescibacteria group bacterium]